jgi:hypothetical protein
MQSNRDSAAAVTRAASKSKKNTLLPPRPTKRNPSSSDAADALARRAADTDLRRAQRSELLSKLKQKRESVSRQTKRHTSSIASSTEGSKSTIVTRARAQQHDKRAKQGTSGSYVEMSPVAFHDYRASTGRVRLPVNEVNIDTLKSPAASTLGGMSESLLSSVQPETSSVQPAETLLLAQPETSVWPTEVIESSNEADNASIGASSTESALLELFSAKKTAPSSKKKRKKERTQPSVSILREMLRAAAFDAQTFVFTQIDNTSKEGREAAIFDHFHGTTSQLNNDDTNHSIQGTIHQLISGHGAYVALYDEGDTIGSRKELILKTRYCGRMESASRYISGMHFTANMVSAFGQKKAPKVSGRSLWELAKETLLNLKKAMALVKKLDNIVILDDKSNRVIDYMSGKNEDSFFTAVVNGMWQLKQSKRDKKRKSNDTGKIIVLIVEY